MVSVKYYECTNRIKMAGRKHTQTADVDDVAVP